MSEWQPIETAPKDGRFILLWDANSSFTVGAQDRICATGAWIIDPYHGSGAWQVGRDDDEYAPSRFDSPSHWMPLPEAPGGRDSADER